MQILPMLHSSLLIHIHWSSLSNALSKRPFNVYSMQYEFFLQLFLFLFIFFANISSIILSIWHRFASCKIPRCNILSVMYMCGTTVCLIESAFFKRWWSYKFMTRMKVLQTFWCSVRKPMLNIWDQAFQINMLSSELLTKYSFHITNHIVYLSNDLQLS